MRYFSFHSVILKNISPIISNIALVSRGCLALHYCHLFLLYSYSPGVNFTIIFKCFHHAFDCCFLLLHCFYFVKSHCNICRWRFRPLAKEMIAALSSLSSRGRPEVCRSFSRSYIEYGKYFFRRELRRYFPMARVGFSFRSCRAAAPSRRLLFAAAWFFRYRRVELQFSLFAGCIAFNIYICRSKARYINY